MRVGRIRISEQIFLNWLQFPDARVRSIRLDDYPGQIEITLEDAEMPKVPVGGQIPFIDVTFICYSDCEGHFVNIREKESDWLEATR